MLKKISTRFRGFPTWKKIGCACAVIIFFLVVFVIISIANMTARVVERGSTKVAFAPVEGRVVDINTGKPLSDVYVFSFVSPTQCKQGLVKTGNNGRYRLPGGEYRGYNIDITYKVVIYRPGYLVYEEDAEKFTTIRLMPYEGGSIPCEEWPKLNERYCTMVGGSIPCEEWPMLNEPTVKRNSAFGQGSAKYYGVAYDLCRELNDTLDRTRSEVNKMPCDYNLFNAIADGSTVGVREIVAKYPELVNRKNSDDSTPLFAAIDKQDAKMVAILLEAGAEVMPVNKSGWTPLHQCVAFGSYNKNFMKEVIALLLQYGADINARDSGGATPLNHMLQPDLEILEFLLQSGADPGAQDNSGNAPLHLQIRTGTTVKNFPDPYIELLINYGADVNARDNDGATPLHFTSTRNQVLTLIAHGADIFAKDKKGYEPIHNLVLTSCKECIEVLLQNGAKIDARTEQGDTPLHVLVSQYHDGRSTEMLKLLIKKGADVNARNKAGKTPLSINAYPDYGIILKTHGGRID